jgi:hypothetical protein
LFSGIQNRPYVFIAQGLIDTEGLIQDRHSAVFRYLPDEMDLTSSDWQFCFCVKDKIIGKKGLCISRHRFLAEVFFSISLIGIMIITKLRRFCSQVFQVGKPVFIPYQILKASVKAFNMAVTPWFIKRNKDHLDSEIQTEPNQFAKGFGVIHATPERCFVINLQKTGNAIRLPILYQKGQDTVCILRIELLEICPAGTDINTIDGHHFAVSADKQRGDDIHLVQKTRILCFGLRVKNGLLFTVDPFSLFNQSVAFENTINGRQAWLSRNAFAIQVLVNTNGATKGVFGVWLIMATQALPRGNDRVFDFKWNLVRSMMWLRSIIKKPVRVFGLASFDPLICPVPRSIKLMRDIKYCLATRVEFKTTLSKKNLIFCCMTFLDIQELLQRFILDIKCSRCPDIPLFTMS